MKNILKLILFLGFLGTLQAQNSTQDLVIEGYLTKVEAQPLGYSNRQFDMGDFTCTFRTSQGIQTINTLKVTLFNNRVMVNHSEIGVVPIKIKSNGEILMNYPDTSFPDGLIIKTNENIKYKIVFRQICFDKINRTVADVYYHNTTYNANDCQGFTIKEGPYWGGGSDEGVLPRQDTMLMQNWSFFHKDGKIYALVSCEKL